MQITGGTRFFPLVGYPVSRVFSPPAINGWLSENAKDVVMLPLEIAPRHLASFWSLLRHSESFVGCSVTHPHKMAAAVEVDIHTERAARLGALNTICRQPDGSLHGDATDGLALCRALQHKGESLSGRSARVVGAGGGAGRAIVDAFCEAGIVAIGLVETDSRRHNQVTSLITEHWRDTEILPPSAPAEILVNATTLGSSPADSSPFTLKAVEEAVWVCSVTGSPNSNLQVMADQTGTNFVGGHEMGLSQVDCQSSFVFGVY